jgi:uncharacterized protein YjiS (DUF1127 family)
MIDLEKSASARLPAADVWLERGEGLARVAAGVAGGIRRWLGRGISSLARAAARRAALRELYQLDDRLLKDIGLRRDQVGELVDAMFRAQHVEVVARPTGRVVAVGSADISGANAGNDGEYRSAA